MYSPLEQFEILSIVPLYSKATLYLAITNSTLFLIVVSIVLLCILQLITSRLYVVPTRWQSLIEIFIVFSNNMVEEILGNRGLCYFPFVLFLFYFLILTNLVGMVPYSFTITSHIFSTFTLASVLWLGTTLTGFYIHSLKFLSIFLPSGSPIGLAPLFVGLEILSYSISIISLSVSLFANLMAGHSLLNIIAGFAWTLLSMGGIWSLLQIVPICIILAVTSLELAIAFVQAYIFSLLTCLYLNDAINLH